MGDLWQQMIETVVTDEAKTARKTRRQTGQEAAEADAAEQTEAGCAALEAA